MTTKETATAMLAAAKAMSTQADKLQVLSALVDLKKKSKTSWEKLGIDPSEIYALEQDVIPIPTTGGALTKHSTTFMTEAESDMALQIANDANAEKVQADDAEHGQFHVLSDQVQAEEVENILTCSETDAYLEKVMSVETFKVQDTPLKKFDVNRGLITAMVKDFLLNTDLGYATIVENVLSKHPKAKTTARSVASVASDMRSSGSKVPMRRVAAKA